MVFISNRKRVTFYNMQIAFMGAVIFFCILFGVFYGMVQNKTIIQPLQHLSKRMDAVKNGVMEKKDMKLHMMRLEMWRTDLKIW